MDNEKKFESSQISKTTTYDGSASFQTTLNDNQQSRVQRPPTAISFRDVEKGDSTPYQFSKERRLSSNSLFTINEKVGSSSAVLPPIFKSVSHTVSELNEPPLDKKKVKDKDIRQSNTADKFINTTFHTDDISKIVEDFETDLDSGLSSNGVSKSAKQYGVNVQSKPSSGWPRRLFNYFFGGFGALLFVSGVLCIVCWKPLGEPNPAVANLALGIILLVIFLLQAFFNFIQDYSAANVMKSINNMIPTESLVMRSGKLDKVNSRDLVPGDFIMLTAGEKVPADIRIVENSNDLSFDRSILTGESISIPCSNKSNAKDSNYLESSCIAMQGTFISSGTGKGIVVAIGDETIFGSIAKLTSRPKNEFSPLQWEILKLVGCVASVIVVLGVLIIILYFAWLKKSYPGWIVTATLIVDIVSVAVSFIPEGLPVALTTCLLITSTKMRNNKILCKSLSVVETLGAVSVLCFDKTGTITKNDMIVTDICCGGSNIPVQEAHKEENGKTLYHMLTIGTLCNDTAVSSDGTLNGNATDKAVFKFVENIKTRINFMERWSNVFEIAFNSKDKYMAKVLQPFSKEDYKIWADMGLYESDYPNGLNSDDMLLTVKGAPDILMDRCQYILKPLLEGSGVQRVEFTKEIKDEIKAVQELLSRQGKRVILLASKIVDQTKVSFIENPVDTIDIIREDITNGEGLTLVGLVGIEDPPRKHIDRVINTLKTAGIKVVMITGDFELTGVSIAKQVNIVSPSATVDSIADLTEDIDDSNSSNVTIGYDLENDMEYPRAISITGKDINNLTETQWDKVMKYNELVFTRTTPEQKLLIIKQFQKSGGIIGMTGDGINDSPSLKQADVGISLLNASDVAKEAADVILMNDDSEDGMFNSIVSAVEAGRLVFDNLKKTVFYVLPAGTFAELWCVLLNVIFGFPQMLSSFNMIIVSCVTDCLAAITLAYEPCESNLLLKPPRSVSGEKLVNTKLLVHSYIVLGIYDTFASMFCSFLYLKKSGYSFDSFSLSYGTYLSLPDVNDHLAVASSIYFVNLVFLQFFNLLSVRTRYLSIYQQNPWTANKFIFLAILFNLGFTFIINYPPPIQSALGTGAIPVEYYFISLAFASLILIYDEGRKYIVRNYPKSFISRKAW